MKKFHILYPVLICLLFGLFMIGCKEPVVTVQYYVDGVLSEKAPDASFYDIVSIESTNEDANATWNQGTWSLTYTPAKKDTDILIYFEYTKSPFKINNIGYPGLQEAFDAAANTPGATINMTADYSGYGATTIGSDIILNLNGFTLDGVGFDTIINNGKLLVNGKGSVTNSVAGEYSKSIVNYGALTINDVTLTNSTSNVTVWNSNNGGSTMVMNNCNISHTQDCIVFINSGEANLNSCTVNGNGEQTHPTIYSNDAMAVLNLNSGSVTNSSTGYTAYLEEGIINIQDCNIENTYGLE